MSAAPTNNGTAHGNLISYQPAVLDETLFRFMKASCSEGNRLLLVDLQYRCTSADMLVRSFRALHPIIWRRILNFLACLTCSLIKIGKYRTAFTPPLGNEFCFCHL